MSHFSQTIKNLRIKRGLTQQQLADCLGFSKSSINMYERGEREPDFQRLALFGDFFDVDMNYLLTAPKITTVNKIENSFDHLSVNAAHAIEGTSPEEQAEDDKFFIK